MEFEIGFTKLRRMAMSLALVVSAGVAASQSSAQDLNVGVQQVPPDEVFLAKDWAEPYDVDLNITQFSSGGDMMKAFVAGRVDIANGGSGRLVTLAAQRPDSFYIVGKQQSSGDRYGIVVKPDAEEASIEDLKGKKFAAVTGTGAYGTFLVYLEGKGLTEDDFEVINMKVNDIRSAVDQGLVAGGLMWEPFVAIAENQGSVKRIDSLDGVNESPNFLLVRREVADENPEAVVKFLAAMIDAGKFITENPREAGELAAQQIAKGGVEVPASALELAFTRLNVDRKVTPELVDELLPVAEAMKAAGKIDEIPDFHQFVRTDLYEQAVEMAGSNS